MFESMQHEPVIGLTAGGHQNAATSYQQNLMQCNVVFNSEAGSSCASRLKPIPASDRLQRTIFSGLCCGFGQTPTPAERKFFVQGPDMPISVECPQCGKKLKAADSAGGKKAKCPGCGEPVPIPARKKRPKPQSDGGDELDLQSLDVEAGMAGPIEHDQVACPACGEMINAVASKCRFCGENLATIRKKKKKKRGRSGPGLPVSIIVAVAVECLFIFWNLFTLVRSLTTATPVPANIAPEQAQIVKISNTLGLVLQGILILVEIAIAVGLLQGKNSVRILALILDGMGAVFFVICGGVGMFVGMQAMAQLPQGQEGVGVVFAVFVLLGRGVLYITQFGALQSSSARDYLGG
jgi:hypothetical protein